MQTSKILLAATIALSLLAGPAQAQNKSVGAGDWLVRVGATVVDPESTGLVLAGPPTSVVSADSAASLTFNATYMFTQNLGLELLAALPFEHDIEIDGAKVGSAKQLPPTLSLQWHAPIGQIVPYVGLGVNWTIFFYEDMQGADLKLDNSFGIAAQAGFDWVSGNNWLLNFDVRYISIETDAKLNGVPIGTVDVNPWIYGINIGYKF